MRFQPNLHLFFLHIFRIRLDPSYVPVYISFYYIFLIQYFSSYLQIKCKVVCGVRCQMWIAFLPLKQIAHRISASSGGKGKYLVCDWNQSSEKYSEENLGFLTART